jgi:hypothetical protein
MKTMLGMKLYLVTAGLAVALVAGGCAMMAPKAERYVRAPVGSTFTYAYHNSGSFGSRTGQLTTKATERMWEGKPIAASESPLGVTLLNPDGAWPAQLAPDGTLVRSFNPPIGFDFPLTVGKTWTRSYQVTMHATNKTLSFDTTWKVEAYEDVTVPAGTFKTFKIVYSDTTGQETIYWFDPKLGTWPKASFTRTAKFAAGPGTNEVELVSYTIAK